MADWQPGQRATDPRARPPLPALPQFPGLRGYAALDRALRELGFRHAADLLRATPASPGGAPAAPPSPGQADEGFRVLDGLWFPGRGTLWRRVDLEYVQRVRDRWGASADPRGETAADLADTLETLLRDDPMGLRRLVLWQLGCRLLDGPGGPTGTSATALGVHSTEAGPLAAAVAADFPAAGPARTAAETINEIWPGPRLREALRVAVDLPAAPADHRLAGLLADLRASGAEADRLMGDALRRERDADPRAAAATWLRAARQAPDDPRARAGLLRAAVRVADGPHRTPAPAVVVEDDGRAVRLTWADREAAPQRRPRVGYQVVRIPGEATDEAVEVPLGDTATAVLDSDVPVGQPLRYAVLPVRRGRIAGTPRVTAPVVLTPEVADARAESVPEGVRLRWRADPSAADIRAVRRNGDPEHPGEPVPCHRDGLTDRPLPPGTYHYEVSCGYPGPDGELVWSAGRRVTAAAHLWPSPVEGLTVRHGDAAGPVRVECRPPARGQGRVVPWTSWPVRPGEDVSELVGRLPRTGGASAELAPPPGTRVRATAVSVLGDRAVSGPSVVIEHPGTVRNLTVHRPGRTHPAVRDRALVTFDWPDPAVLVLVEWEPVGGGPERMRVPRSRYRTERRVEIPVSDGEWRVTVTPLPRPDAVVVATGAAHAVLPAAPSRPWWPWWRRWRALWRT
ncbi:hypothetical protein AQ490_21885 [Wenjunlia vitaminophila]|uniref:Fibronectin type-III domain-containing protein n=1 Tax=Wenjunlia vitaminophila TaxID=76728 RepID=A0A0T6LSZ9_WENVI|nr:hypothetical protein [Wenjunlia vitaminophila]KRV48975.1 hypothetical protein AQ490_21885 [Wenjunlia vitaminophila]